MNLTALFAASVEPFYFESIDLNDTAAQQAEWDYLMKYKIFGQNGIDFKGGKISIPDKVGWFGTADGDFTLANTNHNVGGPILIGGDMKFDDGIDTISTGPVRVLGSIYTSNFNGPNILNGIHCVGGTIADKYLQSLNGPKYPLEECPETVPVIKEDLSIPRVDYTGKVFNPKITLNNSTAYIDVPEGEGPYDYYLEGISFDNPGNLIVRMPSGGRLTRIFIQNNINFGPHPTIKVYYMATDAVNEAGVWTGAYQEIQNSDYAGNLLFYVDNDIAVPSISASDSIQGTFISTGTISIEQHMTLAGQLLANKVTINFNFDGSGFLYVPFDPPVLNIDPTALGSGVFIESNEDQKVNITLDILPETDVVFDYCFEIDTSETAPIGVAHWSDFGPLNNGKIMPICGRDTATLTIKEGFLKPDLNNEVFVHPRLDGIVEGLETFQLMVFNLMGAVLPGNLKSGSFTLSIKDADASPNTSPVILDQIFSIKENSPAGTVVGTVIASDPDINAPFNELEFSVLSGSGKELFKISSTGVITVKEGAVLDLTIQKNYTLEVVVQDGGGLSDTATVTINIEDVNEAPNIADQDFSVEENSPAGTVVGIVIASDPDINAPFNELEFSVLSGSGKELFEISSTGVITVKEGAVLDYESKDSYSLEVKVQDGGGLSDTATITVRLVDVNESPSIANQTFSVKEDINSNVKIGSIIYKDPENDVLSFTLEEDPSGIFQVTEYGDIYLKEGASLDFETKDTYKIKVKGVDPGGLFDIAEITIRVLDVFEKSEVEIIKAISKDSIYLYPDIIYINTLDIELEWKENGVLKFGDTTLNEGKNIIVKELCEISKNECGRDTLIVYVNTKSPTVTLTPKKNTEEKISGVTIVEQQNNLDSAYYVNQNDNKILVNLQEEGINGEPVNKTFELTAKLDTIHLSKKNIETTQKISQAWSFEKSQDIKVLTVDGVQKATYTTTIDGVTLTVTYDLNGSDNKAVVEYETQIDGKKVIISYVADTKTGKVMTDPKTGAFYTVSYPYLDANKNEILVSYGVTESGKLIKDPQDESVLYTLTYAYTNLYGNTGTKSIEIVLDKTPPVVQIIGPLEGSVVSGVSVNVIWTVDGVEQDTLNLQGLEGGVNYIIRAFRDKAGNERSDTVVVYSKGTKDIVVQMQESLIEIDKKTMALFSNPNQDNKTRYRVTVLNAKTGLEEEVVVGTDKGSKAGNRKEPYPNLTGSHLGPTLDIDLKLPSLNPLGGMASIGDLVESDGLIAIESGGGWDREKVSVEEYVSKYCSDEFQRDYRQNSSFDEALYNVSVSLHMWIFTSLGSFVESYNVKLDIDSKEYANAAGVAKLFFELVPNAEGYLVDNRGRSLGTGAYLFKTEIQMLFEQRCALPDQTPIGKKKKVFENWLSSFGYKRLNLK